MLQDVFSSDKLYDQCGCINSCGTNCNVDATYMYNTNRNDHYYFTSTMQQGSPIQLME
jgi:hypothetical protein